jgi:hypothetical protein
MSRPKSVIDGAGARTWSVTDLITDEREISVGVESRQCEIPVSRCTRDACCDDAAI